MRIKAELAHANAALASAKSVAAQSGIPPVDNTPAPPLSQNAASMYMDWIALRRTRHFNLPDYADPLNLSFDYTPEEVQTVRELYANNSDIDRAMMKAVRTPIFYNAGPADAPFAGYKVYAPAREAARETCTKSTCLRSTANGNLLQIWRATAFLLLSS
jgi:hypothetical protein